MKAFRRLPICRETDGSTVLEVTVALALLVVVLVPTVGLLSHFILTHRAERQLMALTLGRQVMEATLAEQRYTSETWDVTPREMMDAGDRTRTDLAIPDPATGADAARWRVKREVRTDDGLVTIRVRVYPINHSINQSTAAEATFDETAPPSVDLTTMRIAPSAGEDR